MIGAPTKWLATISGLITLLKFTQCGRPKTEQSCCRIRGHGGPAARLSSPFAPHNMEAIVVGKAGPLEAELRLIFRYGQGLNERRQPHAFEAVVSDDGRIADLSISLGDFRRRQALHQQRAILAVWITQVDDPRPPPS